MPLPKKYRDELIERHATAEREARRASRGDLLRTIGHISFWTLLGIAVFAVAFRVSGVRLGMVFYWAGASVWFGGVVYAVLAAYKRGEDRGDW